MPQDKHQGTPKHTILPKSTLPRAVGLLATDQPSPNDEEIQRWLDAHRMEKYGAVIVRPLPDPKL